MVKARAAHAPDPERRARYRRGHLAELIAAALLTAKGYRVLARRYRCPLGEIDLIARRAGRIAFVEVKRRPTLAAAQESVTTRQRQRIRRAAEHWLARHPRDQEREMGLDVILLARRRLPRHIENALW